MSAVQTAEFRNLWRLTKGSIAVLVGLIDVDKIAVSMEGLRVLRDHIDNLVLAADTPVEVEPISLSSTVPVQPIPLPIPAVASEAVSNSGIPGITPVSSGTKRGRPSNADLAMRAALKAAERIWDDGPVHEGTSSAGNSVQYHQTAGSAAKVRTPKALGVPSRPYSDADRKLLEEAMNKINKGEETRIAAVHRLSAEMGRTKSAVQVQLSGLKAKEEGRPFGTVSATKVANSGTQPGAQQTTPLVSAVRPAAAAQTSAAQGPRTVTVGAAASATITTGSSSKHTLPTAAAPAAPARTPATSAAQRSGVETDGSEDGESDDDSVTAAVEEEMARLIANRPNKAQRTG